MNSLFLLQYFGAACAKGNLLGFPVWYEYLNQTTVNGSCSLVITNINDVWLIVAAIIEILLRVAGLLAVGFIIYGGFQYLTSQAEPDKLMQARKTITNALIGLVLAILSATIINFIASSIK